MANAAAAAQTHNTQGQPFAIRGHPKKKKKNLHALSYYTMCDGEKKYVVSPGPWGLNSKRKKKAEEGGVKIIPYIKNEIPSARVKKKK